MNKRKKIEQRTYATICIHHEFLSSKEMIEILEMEPSRTSDKGESKREVSSGCYYSSRGEIQSIDVRDHLTFLILNYNKTLEKVNIKNKYGFKSWISIFWESKPGDTGPIISAKHMNYFANLGLDFSFDYWYW